jgi:hypothetical protein
MPKDPAMVNSWFLTSEALALAISLLNGYSELHRRNAFSILAAIIVDLWIHRRNDLGA